MVKQYRKYLILIICIFFVLSLMPAYGDNAAAHFQKGLTCFDAGKYEEAIKEFQATLKLDETYGYPCYYNIGLSLQKLGKYEKAIDNYTKCINYTTDPKNFCDTYFYIGFCYHNMKQYNKAIDFYNKSNEYEMGSITFYNIGVCYEQLGDAKNAVEAYDTYLQMDPDGEFSEDVKKWISKLSPSTSTDYIDLAYKYYQGAEYDKAIEAAQNVLSSDPNSGRAHYIIALCYDDQGDKIKALEEYEKSIEVDPSFPESYNQCGLIYMREEDYNRAIFYFNNSLDLAKSASDKAIADFYLGVCHYSLGDNETAIKYYDDVLKFDGNDKLTHYNLGLAYYNLGNEQKALEHYRKYLKLDPSGDYAVYAQQQIAAIEGGVAPQNTSANMSADDYYNRGLEYRDKQQYEEAIKDFQTALEIDPKHAYANNELGVIYYNVYKDYPLAAYYFLAALELDPKYSLAVYNVALIYEKQERYEEAIEKYNEYLKLEPQDENRAEVESIIAALKQKVEVAPPTPTPSPVTVASNNPPVIEIVEPASLIGQKNLVLEETSPQVTSIRLVGVVSSDDIVTKVTINGQPVELSIPSAKNLEVLSSQTSYKYQFATNVGLSIGKNVIKIQAWDIQNNKAEKEVSMNFNPEQKNVAETNTVVQKGEKWAVIIGIGNYQSPSINKLNYTVADAEGVYKFLTTKGGFKEDHVKLLINSDATTKNIKSALGTFLARKSGKNDMVFIYYSGHGAPEIDPASTDGDGMSKYIVTYDADPEDLYSTAFSMEEIRKIFQRIDAGRVAFFIDACYSGSAGGRTFSKPGLKAGNVSDQFLNAFAEGEGRVLVTASGTNEVSLEVPELGHGIFTYYLLKGLEGEAADKDKAITIDGLYNYISDNVQKASKSYGGSQHPMKKGETSGRFVIINY